MILLSACEPERPKAAAATASAEPAPQAAEAPEAKPINALVGKPAPDFTLKGLDGKPVHLAALKGKPVVLDFWATWCPSCIKLLPRVQKLHREMGGRVIVLGVNDEEPAKIKAFLDENNLTVPQVMDSADEAGKAYSVGIIPFTVFIDKNGTIKAVHEGINLDHDLYADLKGEVDKLL